VNQEQENQEFRSQESEVRIPRTKRTREQAPGRGEHEVRPNERRGMTEQVCPSHINAAFDVGAHAPRGEIAGGGRMAAAWSRPYVRWARCQRWRATMISYPQPWHDRRALASNRPALRVGYPLGAVAPGRRKVRRGTLWVWHPNQSERFPGASRAQRQKE